jgi:hypothetical protein
MATFALSVEGVWSNDGTYETLDLEAPPSIRASKIKLKGNFVCSSILEYFSFHLIKNFPDVSNHLSIFLGHGAIFHNKFLNINLPNL